MQLSTSCGSARCSPGATRPRPPSASTPAPTRARGTPDGCPTPGLPDAGPVDASDAGRPSGDAGAPTCVADPERVYKLGSDATGGDRIVGLAAGANAFGVVWTQLPTSGGLVEVHGERISSSGARGTTQRITSRGQQDRSEHRRGGHLVGRGVGGQRERHLRAPHHRGGGDLAPGSATVHDLTATPTLREDGPVFLNSSAGLMLAWTEDDMSALTRVARAQQVANDGTPTGSPGTASASGQQPGQLATGELDGGPVLVWSEGIGGSGTVYLQGITTAGAMRGTRTRVSTEDNADGTVDAALLPTTGGAVVFGVLVDGVRHEVRFREVPSDGAVTDAQPERVLANGTGASVARFAGGYAISYRAPASGDTPSMIHLMLVQSNGDLVSDVPVIEAPSEGARTTVRVSGDGQIAITWADTNPGATDIRVAMIACGAGS
ncbi:MAG: hypothetical protein M5U28_47545 [Sandaracinaceae bacterium]|nr:hypothetical protein [Sandaracinaceae bacterium]